MSLAHAILGILHDQPMTGYDLKTRCFDGSIAHFWPADQSQIYRTLEKMRADGWLDASVETQEDRPNRKVYSVTEAGSDELDRWIDDVDPDIPVYREPLLIQLFFGHRRPRDRIIEKLRRQRAAHEKRLATYGAIPLPELGTPNVPVEYHYQRMTLDLGIRITQTHIDWIDHCLAHLEALGRGDVPPTPASSRQ